MVVYQVERVHLSSGDILRQGLKQIDGGDHHQDLTLGVASPQLFVVNPTGPGDLIAARLKPRPPVEYDLEMMRAETDPFEGRCDGGAQPGDGHHFTAFHRRLEVETDLLHQLPAEGAYQEFWKTTEQGLRVLMVPVFRIHLAARKGQITGKGP